MSAATAARRSAWMSARETEAPREERRCAVARPMPEAAPVMAITFPEREVIVGRGDGRRGDVDGSGEYKD